MALIEVKELHLHIDFTGLDRKADKILHQLFNLQNIMARSKQEFTDLATEVRSAFANIAADITRLTDSLQNGGLTEAEEEEVFAEFRTLADEANALAGRTPESPVEPAPEA